MQLMKLHPAAVRVLMIVLLLSAAGIYAMFQRRLLATLCLLLTVPVTAAAQQRASLESFFNVASPLELTAAKSADRIAWNVYEAGLRNVYTAIAPDFEPVRLTSFTEDDGRDVNGVRLSDDGAGSFIFRLHDNLDHAPGAQG